MLIVPAVLELGEALTGPAAVTGLAADDLDEDGIADLVVGIANHSTGEIAVLVGNPAAIYPNGVRARRMRAEGTFSTVPFPGPPRLTVVPVIPELLATADLDNDGHADVVLGLRGDRALWLLLGDGQGGFRPARQCPLPGGLVTLVTGEVDSIDGLGDLLVVVEDAGMSQLLVYEDDRGALQAPPEAIVLPAPVLGLAVAELSPGLGSVVMTTAQELLLVPGRDTLRGTPGNARLERLPLPGTAVAAAVRRGSEAEHSIVVILGDGRTLLVPHDDLGGLATGARSASHVSQGIVELGRAGYGDSPLQIVTARIDSNPGEELIVIGRDGISVASLLEDDDHKQLSVSEPIEGISVPLAVLGLRLGPAATDQLVVAQSGSDHPLLAAAHQAGPTFEVNTSSDASDATLDGICETATGNGSCTLRAAIEETNNATETPVTISFAKMSPGEHILVPLSEYPHIAKQVIIDGTTHPDGMVEINGIAAGTVDGLWIKGALSTVRGLSIHSFAENGIWAHHSIVEGCNIGVDVAADTDLGNGGCGVGGGSQIGGPAVEARCVISGNACGVCMRTNSSVQGSLIGTDGSGTFAIPNNIGVSACYFNHFTIGGTAAGEGNLISGNTFGVNSGEGEDTRIWGNLIGTDITGTAALGNSNGVELRWATYDQIGGPAALAGNTISGNSNLGISITSNSYGTIVQGNRIGTDAAGNTAVANLAGGIVTEDSKYSTIIDNVISGNQGHGLEIFGDGYGIATENFSEVRGNIIGSGVDGGDLGNSGHGILMQYTSSNTIGGTEAGQGNQISYNSLDGITVIGEGIANSFTRNLFFGNGGQAIDLDDDGVTTNDPSDADEGSNRLMSYPVLTTAEKRFNGTLQVSYGVDADPAYAGYDLRVELYAAGADGQGKTFLASDTWTAANYAAGSKTVLLVNEAPATPLELIVATATDADGNTSEQSVPVPLTTQSTDIFSDGFESSDTSAWDVTVQ